MLELNLNCRTPSWCNRELLDVAGGGGGGRFMHFVSRIVRNVSVLCEIHTKKTQRGEKNSRSKRPFFFFPST